MKYCKTYVIVHFYFTFSLLQSVALVIFPFSYFRSSGVYYRFGLTSNLEILLSSTNALSQNITSFCKSIKSIFANCHISSFISYSKRQHFAFKMLLIFQIYGYLGCAFDHRIAWLDASICVANSRIGLRRDGRVQQIQEMNSIDEAQIRSRLEGRASFLRFLPTN